jgi:putative NADPH-quinone reductase
MAKRILVLNGNPKQTSFSAQLAVSYAEAAKENHEVRVYSIAEMDFDPDLNVGYDQAKDLEPALVDFQESLKWAQHLVIITPIWWGALPAKLKGLFDRTLLPGFAFSYRKGKSIPDKLLKGKTARIIMTMDTPTWYYKYIQGAPALKQLKVTTLRFCGFKDIRHQAFGPVTGSNESKRRRWLDMVRRLGQVGK